MSPRLPTTAQAERIHQLFDEAVASHPGRADLLRRIERTIIQQPDDSGPGLPEPLESLVQPIIAGVLGQGPLQRRRMRRALRGT